MKYVALFLGLLLLEPVAAHGSAAAPQRIVSANTITSDRDPRVRINLPKGAAYAGTDRWILFGIANCQLFAFVEADAQKHVQRLYWVQFEGYVPTMPKLHHIYNSKEHAPMGGMNFYVDTWTQPGTASKPDIKPLGDYIKAKGYAVPTGITSGSDEQHIYRLIASKGYTLPHELLSVRFVHTFDEQRKELMIIYSESFPAGHKASDEEKRALVQRAESALQIEPLKT